MHTRSWPYLLIGLAVGALARCTDLLAPCSGAVTVTSTSSVSPTLSWTPNCRIDKLVVEEPLPIGIRPSRAPGDGALLPHPSLGRWRDGWRASIYLLGAGLARAYKRLKLTGPAPKGIVRSFTGAHQRCRVGRLAPGDVRPAA